jgi:hypothetical protein
VVIAIDFRQSVANNSNRLKQPQVHPPKRFASLSERLGRLPLINPGQQRGGLALLDPFGPTLDQRRTLFLRCCDRSWSSRSPARHWAAMRFVAATRGTGYGVREVRNVG